MFINKNQVTSRFIDRMLEKGYHIENIEQVYSRRQMSFEEYKYICEDIINMGDFRERIIQEFLIRPF